MTARFVILTHDHPELHWDFMLECGEKLRTWRLIEEPDSGGTTLATLLPDHRIEYLDYEGPVSGNRGTVTRWDTGRFEWIVEKADQTEISLLGDRLDGVARLTRDMESDEWRFDFRER